MNDPKAAGVHKANLISRSFTLIGTNGFEMRKSTLMVRHGDGG